MKNNIFKARQIFYYWPQYVPPYATDPEFHRVLCSIDIETFLPRVPMDSTYNRDQSDALANIWPRWCYFMEEPAWQTIKPMVYFSERIPNAAEPLILLGIAELVLGYEKLAISKFRMAIRTDRDFTFACFVLDQIMHTRRPPAWKFLPRNHGVNRVLGQLTHRMEEIQLAT